MHQFPILFADIHQDRRPTIPASLNPSDLARHSVSGIVFIDPLAEHDNQNCAYDYFHAIAILAFDSQSEVLDFNLFRVVRRRSADNPSLCSSTVQAE